MGRAQVLEPDGLGLGRYRSTTLPVESLCGMEYSITVTIQKDFRTCGEKNAMCNSNLVHKRIHRTYG